MPGAFHVSQDGVVVSGSVQVTAGGRAIAFAPGAPWLPGALVQVFLDSTATATSGNALQDYQGSFRTSADPATLQLSVQRVSLDAAPSGLPPQNTVIEVEYNKPLDPATVNGGTVTTNLTGVSAAPEHEDSFDGTLIPGIVPEYTISGLTPGLDFRAVIDNTLGYIGYRADTMMGSFDENGTLLVLDDDGSALGDGLASSISGVVNSDGTVRLKVTGYPDGGFTGAHGEFGDFRLFVVVGGATSAVGADVSLVRGGRVVRIVPNAPLAVAIRQEITISGAVQDLSGQAASGYTRTFNAGIGVDATAPVVEMVSPPDKAVDVPLNPDFRARFDEPINPLTVSGDSILATDGSGAVVPCAISFSNDGRDVRIVPHSLLAANQVYGLTISEAEDLAGNPVVAQTTTFTTTTAPDGLDTARPQVVSTSPLNGAMDVPVNSPVVLRVNEWMDPLSVNAQTLRVQDNTTFRFLAGSNGVSNDGRSISFAPAAPFSVGNNYTVFASESTAQDLVGNTIIGADFSFTTEFTGDTTAPVLVGVSPVGGAADVPINARIQVRFDEPVRSTLLDGVRLEADGALVPVTVSLSEANRVLTLAPQSLLNVSTLHTLTVDGIVDLAGNVVPVATGNFTTGTTVDLTPPTLTQLNIANNAIDVPVDTVVHVSFSEVMNGLTLDLSTFFVDEATTSVPVAGTVTVAADGFSATFTPDVALKALTGYRVRTVNMEDLAGNRYSGPSAPVTFVTAP